jgi:hypothetical protein
MTSSFPLIDKLQAIPDYRKPKGRRHDLWLLLLLVLLGTLCGYRGYRPLEEFCRTHWLTLGSQLSLPASTRIPSYSTFRRLLHQADFEPLLSLFNEWVSQMLPLSKTTWVSGDGKAIKSTLSDYSESSQSFINTVSAFTHEQGLVMHLQVADNKQGSEQQVVEQLITALNGQPVIFTFDALHCQKKRWNALSFKNSTI